MFNFLFLFIALFSLPLATAAEQTHTQKLTIGVSISIPPWVIKDTNSGIELDILEEALGLSGIHYEPIYMPFARVIDMFERGNLDGLINAKPDVIKQGYLTDTVVTFENVAISLKNKGYPIDISMDALKNKRVVAFQRAAKFLGPRYAEISRQNKHYQEVSKQALQINLLFIREVDFIVIDKSIFGYYWHDGIKNAAQQSKEIQDSFRKKIVFHPLFERSDYAYAFKTKEVRDAFNHGLRHLKQSGRYQEILDQYNHLRNLYQSSDLSQK